MNNIIRIGILGCADIAQRAIIPAIHGLPEFFRLYGIASRNFRKACDMSKKYDCLPFGDYDELLNSHNLEAIYIPLPNALHAEWIEKSIERGLHVLVEKPLACNLSDVVRLNNMASSKKIILLENFQFRFHRQFKRITEIIESGECGELRCIRSSFGIPPFPDDDNIRYQKTLGGGAFLDSGVYPLKVSQIIMGNDIQIKAAKLSYDCKRDIDIWGGGFIQQKHGDLFSEIAFGFDHFYQCSLEIWGSKGRLTANRIFTAPPGYESEIIIESSKGTVQENIPPDNHFKNMLCYFHELISGKKDPSNEYIANTTQAILVDDFKRLSNE
jgi:dTDP-3,4-didehydro-2,6-dideoxy-alpha-D-glucose 3-reductase